MSDRLKLIFVRLLPVILLTGAGACVVSVEGPDAYAIRNFLPLVCVSLLSLVTLLLGHRHWLDHRLASVKRNVKTCAPSRFQASRALLGWSA